MAGRSFTTELPGKTEPLRVWRRKWKGLGADTLVPVPALPSGLHGTKRLRTSLKLSLQGLKITNYTFWNFFRQHKWHRIVIGYSSGALFIKRVLPRSLIQSQETLFFSQVRGIKVLELTLLQNWHLRNHRMTQACAYRANAHLISRNPPRACLMPPKSSSGNHHRPYRKNESIPGRWQEQAHVMRGPGLTPVHTAWSLGLSFSCSGPGINYKLARAICLCRD